MTLHERVTAYVGANPGGTIEEIARAVHHRTAAVREVLSGSDFSAALRLSHPSDRALVYDVARKAGDGRGRAVTPSQCDLIAAVLRDGEWHTAAAIHQRCGYSRLNSRIAELRRIRHMLIDCEHIPGAGRGAEAYRYIFRGYDERDLGAAA